MPIDQEGLSLITQMLNKIMELQNMPVAWNEQQARNLEVIHKSLLYLKQLWEEFEDAPILAHVSYELRHPFNLIIGYAKLLKMGIEGEIHPDTIPNLDFLEVTGTSVFQKIITIIDKHRASDNSFF